MSHMLRSAIPDSAAAILGLAVRATAVGVIGAIVLSLWASATVDPTQSPVTSSVDVVRPPTDLASSGANVAPERSPAPAAGPLNEVPVGQQNIYPRIESTASPEASPAGPAQPDVAVKVHLEQTGSSSRSYTRTASEGGLFKMKSPIRASVVAVSAATPTKFEFQQSRTISGVTTLVTVLELESSNGSSKNYSLPQPLVIDAIKVTCSEADCRYALAVLGD